MIYLLTFAGIAISLVLWRHLHELDDKSSITHTTISGALEFLATFSAVGVFYSALQLWINSSAFDPSDYVSIHQMELNIVNIRHALLPVLDLNKRIELVVITFLVILAAFSPIFGKLRVVPKTKLTLKWLRRVYILLTILASFTFFGSAAHAASQNRTAEIKAKIEEVQAGYQHYQAKLERIARRVVIRSLTNSADGTRPVREYTQYVQNRVRAIERIRRIPHSALITMAPDAEEYDHRFSGQFNRLKDAVKTEENRVDHSLSSVLPSSAVEDGTAELAKDLNADADSVLASTDDESDGLVAVVEEAATLLHEETSKKLIERIVSAISGIAGETELFKLFYEPFLQTPVEELVKKTADKLFDRTKNRPAMFMVEISAAHESCDHEIANDAYKLDMKRLARTVESLISANRQMDQFAVNADNELTRKAEIESAIKLQGFTERWKGNFTFPDSKVLENASISVLSSFQATILDTRDPFARLQLATTLDQLLNLSQCSLECLEDTFLHSHRIRDAVEVAIQPVLAIDDRGRWGSIRKEIADERWVFNTDDRDTKELLSATALRIDNWRRQMAVEFIWSRQSETVDESVWEREFSSLTAHDGQIAALWGWAVKAKYGEEIRNKYDNIDTPVTGYQYYAAETNLLSEAEVRHVINERPETKEFIDGVCSHLGKK